MARTDFKNFTPEDDDPGKALWERLWFIPALFLLLLVAFRFAEPVGDGDLFWQMAYGKQLLERHALIPDHTLYSWTDAHNETIYCAWVAEIFFYLLYKVGGLNIIFAFRYGVILGSLALAWSYARHLGFHRRSEFWLGLTIFTLASYVGTIIKPELFSFGYMSLLAWTLYRFKLADERKENTWPYVLALPVISCLWANSHGVYVFGMVAMALFTIGEMINYALFRPIALSKTNVLRLMGCALLAVVTMCLTPYFLSYPYEAIHEFLGISTGTQSQGDKSAYASIAAHMTIFQTPAFHFHQYLYVMGTVGVALCGWRLAYSRKAKIDVGYILVNAIFGAIYIWYLRTTFYWPPFFLYSTMWMAYISRTASKATAIEVQEGIDGEDEIEKAETLPARERGFVDVPDLTMTSFIVGLTCQVLIFGLCFRGCYEAYFQPYASSWCGFGITYWNPVIEAEFIEKYHPDIDKLYNDYDSGGWLIWKFYPKIKVMIDPRSFPYRHFYTDYINYERGAFPLDEFHKKWKDKPEVSVVSLKNTQLWRAFLRSPQWVAAWVGPSSVVFCHRDHKYPPDANNFAPNRFDEIRNSQKALQIFQFGIESQLYEYSWKILDVMRQKFTASEDVVLVKNLEAYKASIIALSKQDYGAAMEAQERCRHIGLFYNNSILLQLYQLQMQAFSKAGKRPTDPEVVELFRKSEKAQRGEDPTQ